MKFCAQKCHDVVVLTFPTASCLDQYTFLNKLMSLCQISDLADFWSLIRFNKNIDMLDSKNSVEADASERNEGTYDTRVGWWISKVGAYGVKWKLLGIETAVVKGFFSKIVILDNKF